MSFAFIIGTLNSSCSAPSSPTCTYTVYLLMSGNLCSSSFIPILSVTLLPISKFCASYFFYCSLQLTLINQQIILNIFAISNFSICRARMHAFEPWFCLMLANYPLADYSSESQFSHSKMRIIIISTSLDYCQN